MAFLQAFGSYVPERRVTNEEIARMAGCEPAWISRVCGIEERRWAAAGESVADMAVRAGEDCLARAGVGPAGLGMLIVACGTPERQFPGPASTVARHLGLDPAPALDLPMASAGSLFGLALAAGLAAHHGPILVVGVEKMSEVVLRTPLDRNVAVLFGDGAGACLVSPDHGARILDWAIHSDGAFADELSLDYGAPLAMNGLAVILQASRKLPRVIETLLERNGRTVADVDAFLLHQANRNLLGKVARALKAPVERFPTNIARYGNTSSASLLIAADEWSRQTPPPPGALVVLAAFGAGLHWGAVLAEY